MAGGGGCRVEITYDLLVLILYTLICGALRDLYHLCNFKNVKNTHKGVLILVKLQAEAFNLTNINTPPWVFSTFFKLYKW